MKKQKLSPFWQSQNNDYPPLKAMSKDLFIPFSVAHIEKGCEVLWINHRWFQTQGFETWRNEVFNEITESIKKEFGVHSIKIGVKAPSNFFDADRYGDTNGSLIGGSGRCGIIGDFNAKGIGKTPLTSTAVDSEYSSGKMSLSEAIREAIFSEISFAELPHSAVPIIAILKTGEKYTFDKNDCSEECAIVVRPNFIRPAHFERSIFFGTSGDKCSDQYLDALRVKQMINAFVSQDTRYNFGCFDISEMFDYFSEQLGASAAHRLWVGQFSTSNLSIDGRVVDFGAFRSLSSWQRARGRLNQQFGKDYERMAFGYQSISHYFKKYANRPLDYTSFDTLVARFKKQVEFHFAQSCFEQFPYKNLAPDSAKKFSRLMVDYYNYQQNTLYQEGRKPNEVYRPWIYRDLVRRVNNQSKQLMSTSFDNEISNEIYSILQNCDSRYKDQLPISIAAPHILRWLKPRPLIHFSNAERISRKIVSDLSGEINRDRLQVSKFISRVILKSRRIWSGLPNDYRITSFESDGVSFVIKGNKMDSKQSMSFVYAPTYKNEFFLHGKRLEIESLENANYLKDKKSVSGFLPMY